jgi:UDP-galactopyranose mutase
LICFSHLRWDFAFQRPNHLMSRAARDRRVFFVEEPIHEAVPAPFLRTRARGGVTVVVPVLPHDLAEGRQTRVLAGLMDRLVASEGIERPVVWFYTPMMLPWAGHLSAAVTVYDSMDYLAGFRDAPHGLLALEDELIARTDLLFSGGVSLHSRMADRHPDAHCFPSSVDVAHFDSARTAGDEPADLIGAGRPRLGYVGVIDERIDLPLIAGVAAARPDIQIVLIGPVVKIDPADVPVGPNIVSLGLKPYADLPAYLGALDIGWMPFAHNEATRFISPTKTPEYLAAGLPVISTAINDVVEPYGREGLVTIADTVAETTGAITELLAGRGPSRARVDAYLSRGSWDRTWAAMDALIAARLRPAVTGAARTVREGALTTVPSGVRSGRSG